MRYMRVKIMLLIGSLLLIVHPLLARGETLNAKDIPKSTWIWDATSLADVDIQMLVEQHVKKVYVQVDQAVPIEEYIAFSDTAQQHHIAVYALDGARTWVENSTEAYQTKKWIMQMQQRYKLFVGVHLDIEPYTLKTYAQQKQRLFENYFAILKSYRVMTNEQGLTLEVDMPFWYDEEYYDNRYGSGLVSEFLIRQTDEVAVMAYRDTAEAILEITKSERAYAMKKGKSLTIAVETHPSEEGDYISFATKSPDYFEQQLEAVYAKTRLPIGIHHITSWQALYK